ncbi:MAG: tetratricopeptide repeat protein [Salinivirgaceae bacterium]
MMDNIPGLFGRNEEFNNTLKRFEDMLQKKKAAYFDVEDFINVINFLLQSSQREKARKVISIGLRQHPNTEELMLKEAQVHIMSKNFGKAKQILIKLLNITNGSAEVYYFFGKLYLGAKNMVKALRNYNAALSISDTEEKMELLYLITDDLMDDLKFAQAINYFHMILQLDKYDFEAIIDLTTCYNEIGRTEKALELCNIFLDRDSFNEMVWFHLGMLYERAGFEQEAIDAYEFAIAIEPEYSTAYYSLSEMYSKRGQYEISSRYLKDLVEQEPKNPHAHYLLGENYVQEQKDDKAMQCFEKTLTLMSDFADAWFGIGEIYFREGKITESLFYTKKAIKHDGNEPIYWYRLGIIHQNRKELNYAILAFKKVMQLDPYDELAAIRLGECLFENKNFEKTIKLCNEIGEKFKTCQLNFLQGAAECELGNLTEGLKHIETGLRKDFDGFDSFIYFFPKILSFDAVKKLVNKIQNEE